MSRALGSFATSADRISRSSTRNRGHANSRLTTSRGWADSSPRSGGGPRTSASRSAITITWERSAKSRRTSIGCWTQPTRRMCDSSSTSRTTSRAAAIRWQAIRRHAARLLFLHIKDVQPPRHVGRSAAGISIRRARAWRGGRQRRACRAARRRILGMGDHRARRGSAVDATAHGQGMRGDQPAVPGEYSVRLPQKRAATAAARLWSLAPCFESINPAADALM